MVKVIARSVRGLEWVAADEIGARLPAADAVSLSAREITFALPDLLAGVLALSTVDDVFVDVGQLADVGTHKDVPSSVARRAVQLDWAGWLERLGKLRPLPRNPRFDVVASLEGRRNFNRFALENAVGSALAGPIHGSYLARTGAGRQPGEPDVTVRMFVRGTAAVAALRLADRPLHRRPYKQDTGPGTLHPPVAAAMARLSGLAGGATVADPFCGDGTVAIETALAYLDAHVLASDLDPVRLGNAERNAERAGARLTLRQLDAGQLGWPDRSVDAVLTNPPWNVAVDARGLLRRSLDRFWRQLPDALTATGRLCLLADVELDAPDQLRGMGYHLALATQIRLAGRVSHLVLCAPSQQAGPTVPADLAGWRRRALDAGVVTDTGF